MDRSAIGLPGDYERPDSETLVVLIGHEPAALLLERLVALWQLHGKWVGVDRVVFGQSLAVARKLDYQRHGEVTNRYIDELDAYDEQRKQWLLAGAGALGVGGFAFPPPPELPDDEAYKVDGLTPLVCSDRELEAAMTWLLEQGYLEGRFIDARSVVFIGDRLLKLLQGFRRA